jgi:hypothetical protein
MGIDVYLRWDDQTEEEEKAQITGFSAVHGHVGYLRESYGGEPFATRLFVPEGFDEGTPDEGVPISAATLRERLPLALEAVAKRYADLPKEDVARYRKSYEDFVALAEAKEKALGKPCRVHVSW